MNNIPWRESVLIILMVLLGISFNTVQLRSNHVQIIQTRTELQFLILFCTAYLLFTFDFHGKYSQITKVASSLFVAFIVMFIVQKN